jgi:two-component system CheB/CheR fusion protein
MAKKDITSESIQALHERLNALETENDILKKRTHDINTARDFYLKIFEDFPALIWRAGLDMKCNYFNRTWLDFTGRTMSEEVGDGWVTGVHPDDLDFCFKTYVDSFKKHEAFKMEYRLKNKNGEYRWIRDIGRPFYGFDNEFAGYIGSCYDVTDERENQTKLQDLNNAKDRLFSIIAHDLAGPVSGLKTVSSMISDRSSGLSESQRSEALSLFSETSGKVWDLLHNLLDWARSQQNLIDVTPTTIHIKSIIDDTYHLLREQIEGKDLSFINSINRNDTATADINMITTVFRNIISNAIKYSQPGGTIIITAESSDNTMSISIADNGTGMTDEVISSLFRIDVRHSQPGTKGERGTGLGMIICKEFVEKNRGEISVKSILNEGSTFTVKLPS